ncbi:MAG TPA: hypothetical protein VMU43_11810 [Candidatus Acidoferrum sp.]|nr:hypothetical protein [Candidatus Acidoferrum sp.]
MNRCLLAGTVMFLIAGAAASARAQSTPSVPPAPAVAPVQSADQNSSAANSAPERKVWTNEDMGELRSDSSVSTFQPKGKNAGSNSKGAAANSRGRDAYWYRQQITKLQEKIPPIDAKIAELKKGISGGTVNDPNTSSRPYVGVRPGSWQQQVDDLESRREDILQKIAALQDQARHAGVPDNEIP